MQGCILFFLALTLIFQTGSSNLLSDISDRTMDWLQEKALGWVQAPPVNKIDTHHHFVPDFYAKGMPTLVSFTSRDTNIKI